MTKKNRLLAIFINVILCGNFFVAGLTGLDASVHFTETNWTTIKAANDEISFSINHILFYNATINHAGVDSIVSAWRSNITDISVYMYPCINTSMYSTTSNTQCGSAKSQLIKILQVLKLNNILFDNHTSANVSNIILHPTAIPTNMPTTLSPTRIPTTSPTTLSPTTSSPVVIPVTEPSASPTNISAVSPTVAPTTLPSVAPTTRRPTTMPTKEPTLTPTITPTAQPTTLTPTIQPTEQPTPTQGPSQEPSVDPTVFPSASPSLRPTAVNSSVPSVTPTARPSATPSCSPSRTPSTQPSTLPTDGPTVSPAQVNSRQVRLRRLYVNVEDETPNRYFDTSAAVNVQFLADLSNEATRLGLQLGIYTTRRDWFNVMTTSVPDAAALNGRTPVYPLPNSSYTTQNPFSSLPLWLPRYDGVQSMDFFAPFAGWTSVFVKQTAGGSAAQRRVGSSRVCTNYIVDPSALLLSNAGSHYDNATLEYIVL